MTIIFSSYNVQGHLNYMQSLTHLQTLTKMYFDTGRLGMPYTTGYSASKFAVEGFFSALRQELKLKQSEVSITVAVLGSIGMWKALIKFN